MAADRDVAPEKEVAERPPPTPAPKAAQPPSKAHQPAMFQALEVAGLLPDLPIDPTSPMDGDAARGQSAELSGAALRPVPGVGAGLASMVGPGGLIGEDGLTADARDAALAAEADGGRLQPSHPSEQRRLPRIEAEMQAAVAELVAEAVAAFGLAPGSVGAHVDPAGGRAAAQGTRGLMDGGDVHLDGRDLDPHSADARRLVGHEVAHAGQRGRPEMQADDPIGMAEAEAHHVADRFARGERPGPLRAGLPEGHVAREDGGGAPGGGDVSQLIAQYRQTIEANSATVTPVEGAPVTGGDDNATQNRARKVQQYTDGVDGIADQIGGLDAFDDLCDAYGTFGDGETAGPMARIKASGPYRELCRMWQGAKEGGEDSGAMRAAFNHEFDGRGFWGSTEQAFDLVQANAQADARPEAEAEAARGDLQGPEAAAAEEAVAALEEGPIEPAGGPPAAGPGAGGPGAAMAALMGASVPDMAPQSPAFEQMSAITDDQLDAVLAQSRHQSSFSERAASGEFQSRGAQILETFGDNFLGSFVQGGTDQLMDGLIFDNVGFLADQGLKVATKGRLGTPMVGPLIGLVQTPPWTAEAWGGPQFAGAFENFGNLDETWAAFDSAQDAGDYVGVFCALLADLFGGLRDLLDALATICGTLSALCYVVGGILILVGLALLWLAGVGAPLITAGGWLTRVAGILGRINSALGMIVLALSGLTALFRAAAAFMVPADMYAGQLQGVAGAAGTFGEKTGAKAADVTAGAVNEHIQGPIADRVNDRIAPPGAGDDGGGAADADRIDQALDETRQRLEREAAEQEARDRGDPERRPEGDVDPEQRRDGEGQDDPERARDGDEADATPRSRARRILAAIERAPLVGEAVLAGRDLVDAIGNPRRAAMEGLTPRLRADFDGLLDRRVQDQQARIEQMREQIQGLDGPIDQADKARLEGEIAAAQRDLSAMQQHLERTRAAIAEAEAGEALAREDREREDDDPTRQENIDALRAQGDELRQRLEQAEGDLDTRRPETRERVARLQEQIAALERERAAARTALEGAETEAGAAAETRRRELRAEADRLMGEMQRLTGEADRLDRQAEAAERAHTLRAEAEAAERDAATAQTRADSQRQAMEAHIGERISLVDHDGATQSGMISRKLVGVTAEGVIIAEGRAGTERVVPFADIRYPAPLRESARQYQEAAATAEQSAGQARDQRTTADGLAPEGTDPATLRQQATVERTNAANMQGDYEANNTAALGDTTPAEHRTRVEQARGTVSEQDGAIGTKTQEIQTAQTELRTLETEAGALQTQVQENEAAVRQAEEDARRAASVGSQHDFVHGGSSGNATGGVGSSYTDWGEWLVRKVGLFDGLMATVQRCGGDVAALQARPPEEQTTGAAAQEMFVGLTGLRPETTAQLQQMGDRRAAIEGVLALPPPSDPATLGDKRNDALAAYEQYLLAHARAARAYRAEQIVGELADETGAMAESGQPIRQRAQSMQAPLARSRADEDARAARLGGGGGEIQGPSEPAGGIVGELIMKLATHGDAMDQQPTPPSADAGQQIDSGQQMAATEGSQRSQQSQAASGQQRAFLDAAIQARQQSEQQVGADITTLQGKHQEELAIKESIQQQKARALMERDQHRATVEQHAGGFNTEFQALETWRGQYDAARGRLGE